MAEITGIQKILGVVLVAAGGYLAFDFFGSPEAPEPPSVQRKARPVRAKNPRKSQAKPTESKAIFTPRPKQVVEAPQAEKAVDFAQVWGEDPFVKNFRVDISDTSQYVDEQDIVQLDKYVLSAISRRGEEENDNAVVIINKDILKTGDEIDGLIVEKILSNSVILTKSGRKYILKMKGS